MGNHTPVQDTLQSSVETRWQARVEQANQVQGSLRNTHLDPALSSLNFCGGKILILWKNIAAGGEQKFCCACELLPADSVLWNAQAARERQLLVVSFTGIATAGGANFLEYNSLALSICLH